MRTGGVLNQEVARLLGDEGLGWGLRKGGVVPFVGSYQQGGIVPADGLAQVHQGETIVPNGFQPEIRVFLGTREIEDLVRVEVDEQSRHAGATFLAGALR